MINLFDQDARCMGRVARAYEVDNCVIYVYNCSIVYIIESVDPTTLKMDKGLPHIVYQYEFDARRRSGKLNVWYKDVSKPISSTSVRVAHTIQQYCWHHFFCTCQQLRMFSLSSFYSRIIVVTNYAYSDHFA